MATFISLHKNLNFYGIQFNNGTYVTNDEKEIKFLTHSPAAPRYNISRIDKPASVVIEEDKSASVVTEEDKEQESPQAENEVVVSKPKEVKKSSAKNSAKK